MSATSLIGSSAPLAPIPQALELREGWEGRPPRVRTNVGVRVLYDREGLRLYLQVDQRWVEDTVGLCGTFNGNTQDDFLYVSCPGTGRRGGGGALKIRTCC